MLLAVRDADDALAAAKATEALARLYIRKGLLDDAVGMYAELGKQHAKTVVRDGKTGADLFSDLITDKRFLPYLETPTATWAYPQAEGGGDDDRRRVLGPRAEPWTSSCRPTCCRSSSGTA